MVDPDSTIRETEMPTSRELLDDQLEALLLTEREYIIKIVPCVSPKQRPIELQEWRRKICQWGYRVIDHFRLDREVVAVGMNIFDRFLLLHRAEGDNSSCPCPSCKRMLDSRTYQLAAMTSLYISIKLDHYGKRLKRFKLHSFVELSRGQFVGEDIVNMENAILQTLTWRVHPPTPMTFVSYFLKVLMPHSHKPKFDLVLHVVREIARYLTELSVCLGSECSGKTSSQIALASLTSAMDLLTEEALPMEIRDIFTGKIAKRLHVTTPDLELRHVLSRSLWPELLFDENTQHPIAMARDCGLLDVDRISTTPPGSPKRPTLLHSPVSIHMG